MESPQALPPHPCLGLATGTSGDAPGPALVGHLNPQPKPLHRSTSFSPISMRTLLHNPSSKGMCNTAGPVVETGASSPSTLSRAGTDLNKASRATRFAVHTGKADGLAAQRKGEASFLPSPYITSGPGRLIATTRCHDCVHPLGDRLSGQRWAGPRSLGECRCHSQRGVKGVSQAPHQSSQSR